MTLTKARLAIGALVGLPIVIILALTIWAKSDGAGSIGFDFLVLIAVLIVVTAACWGAYKNGGDSTKYVAGFVVTIAALYMLSTFFLGSKGRDEVVASIGESIVQSITASNPVRTQQQVTERGAIVGRWVDYTAPSAESTPVAIHIGRRYVCWAGGAGTKYTLTETDFGTTSYSLHVVSKSAKPTIASVLITNSKAEAQAINRNC